METCPQCGTAYEIGQWFDCPHEWVQSRKGFEPYWDQHITDTPVWISTPGDKKKYMKTHWKDDNEIRTVERD